MEERKMIELGLVEMTSSELQCRGGISWDNFMSNVKAVVNFIVNYIPKLLSGFASGWKTI